MPGVNCGNATSDLTRKSINPIRASKHNLWNAQGNSLQRPLEISGASILTKLGEPVQDIQAAVDNSEARSRVNCVINVTNTKQRNYIEMGLSTPGALHLALYLSS